MAPVRRNPAASTNLNSIRLSIQNGSQTARSTALQDLIDFFHGRVDKHSEALAGNDDGNLHKLLEAIFHCTLSEKENYFSAKKGSSKPASASRLAKCAEALRTILEKSEYTLKRKTIRATADHITQTLPGPDETFVDPLIQDYVKAFRALLDRAEVVELLGAVDRETWLSCVDFSVNCISRYLEGGSQDSASISRASPTPGTARAGSLMPSTGRSARSVGQRSSGLLQWKDIEEILACLLALLSASNAPIHLRATETAAVLLQTLQVRQKSAGTAQQVAFATLTTVFLHIQAENVDLSKNIAKDLLPPLTHWWQQRGGSGRDAFTNSLRNDMLKLIHVIHLHLKAVAQDSPDEVFVSNLEDLLDALEQEYSRREDRARLQLDDLSFSALPMPSDHPRTSAFSLRPNHIPGEQNWAMLEAMAVLESIFSRVSKRHGSQDLEEDGHSRKRRRLDADMARIRRQLKSLDPGVRLTALHLVPFLLHHDERLRQDAEALTEDILPFVGDKQATISSWAMLACSSCAYHGSMRENPDLSLWRQIWQMAARSISIAGVCRAASVLLHGLLETDIIPYHEIADDVNGIVTTADISGPALLVDSSLTLMLHLLHLRNSILPNASETTSKHIIRWIFVRWTPADLGWASLHSVHANPYDITNLLLASCEQPLLTITSQIRVYGGPLLQNRASQDELRDISRYLLLLPPDSPHSKRNLRCSKAFDASAVLLSETPSSHAARRLALELFFPKLEDLRLMSESWSKRAADGGSQVSADRLHSVVSTCLSGTLFMSLLLDLNSSMSRDVESALFDLLDSALKAVREAAQKSELTGVVLGVLAPYFPSLDTAAMAHLAKSENRHFLQLCCRLSDTLRQNVGNGSQEHNGDTMEIDDDEFDTESRRATQGMQAITLARRDIHLSLTREAFFRDSGLRLHFLAGFNGEEGQIGLVPHLFLEELLALPSDQLLLCRSVMREVFQSDLVTQADDALKVVQAIGDTVADMEFQYCEAAWCTAIDIMEGFVSLWTDEKLALSGMVGDLYVFLVKRSLPGDWLSPRCQIWISRLLFKLLAVKPTYGNSLGQESCRSTLLSILNRGLMVVRYFIALRLPDIFGFYVLKTHDDIFIDILDSLPADPDHPEGIAFRMFALAEMACKWPTLLRRCVYHIFETPGRIARSAEYASCCLQKVSSSLSLESPQELFRLFSPQLLYTWLEEESIDDIPFATFGYQTLLELLRQTKTEAVAIMMMRGQEAAAASLAQKLGVTLAGLIQESFAKVVGYSIAHDISVPTAAGQVTGETRLRKILGKEAFLDAIYLNFVEIIAVFFETFDQESPIEKAWSKDDTLLDAARIMDEIKSHGHLNVQLPPDQQPTFKGKFLSRQIQHLCSRTKYEMSTLWTPAFVAYVVRRLLNSAHPAFGPLNACSVLRKIRVLVCLARTRALDLYPLEMLLRAMRMFVVDPECADDALGISRYLITQGSQYLKSKPSYMAGYALSTLSDLRVFLDSSQASTTQESQFKATKSRAQMFHTWLSGFLAEYDSQAFTSDSQRLAFKSITQSAVHIRSSGNAEKGTHESNLLLEILKDSEGTHQLLNQAAREVALSMLCGTFQIPGPGHVDVIEADHDAIEHGGVVWRSCNARKLSFEYLSWAGRVVGRSFAASGIIDRELVRESTLLDSQQGSSISGSEQGLLRLLESLTYSADSNTAGLAESVLRSVVSDAIAREDSQLSTACQKTLSEALSESSNWNPYCTPPSDMVEVGPVSEVKAFEEDQIANSSFAERLAVHAAQSIAEENILLRLLPRILVAVKGFVDKAFPFIIHLVLLHQTEKLQSLKKHLSSALKDWLAATSADSLQNVKLLLNTILYLRTQPLPNERSIADRAHWLDLDYSSAATAAVRCGMFKVALLFSELAFSQSSRTSRRSSATRDLDESSHVLLKVFENVDDPDARYGLPQEPSLESVLTRLEYEKDGQKTLAFMGAQYDSHLRLGEATAEQDGKSLVKALSSLGLSGLSHSLQQTQQGLDGSSTDLDDTFNASRRIEKWNLPVTTTHTNQAVTLYKTYQTIYNATDLNTVRKAVYDGLAQTVRHVTMNSLSSSVLRDHMAALAALTELDELLSASDYSEMENVLARFETRAKWMMSGSRDDVSQILSCRETSLSMLSQHKLLRNATKLSAGEARLGQVRAMLLSSGIFRFHHEFQESLNVATSLSHLIRPSEELGLSIDAAVRMEVANALWDQREMIPSIRMLQSIGKDSALKKQTVPVSRSDLLSKIAHQVSEARLESPDTIQKKYLDPALRELKGKSSGKEAGQVYHQFARFCDEQLQNPDGLKDLERLRNLKKGKSDEVAQLEALIASLRDSQQQKQRVMTSHLGRAKQWLDLDEQEVRRFEQTRSEFLRLSLENYLLSLSASDEHNSDALRFAALWLERSGEDVPNEAVRRHLDAVPTRKFASLINQLASRLQHQATTFQKLLMNLVFRICVDHPYHGMYQIWAGARKNANERDAVAVLRREATDNIAKHLAKTPSVSAIWQAIDKTSKQYHALAMDKDDRYKAGQKIPVRDSREGQNLMAYLAKYPIPPPTMQLELAADMDYSGVPLIAKLEPTMTIASGVSAPKIVTAVGSNGLKYKQLVKGGNDDLRQDAIMEQVFAAVSELLTLHRDTRQRNLGIRTYKVLPLTNASGLIEFVSDTIPLHEYLMPAHEKYYPKDLKGSQCRREISNVQNKTVDSRISTYRKVTERFHPVMRYFFMEYFVDPDEWFARRLAYTRTTAAISILGHVLGLGDRHGHNILLDSKTGEVVHIDLGVAFEMGRVLPVPELVPFRLTRDIVDGMGITGTEGVFRRCCEFTLDALREEAYSIMTILDVLRYDPLHSWSISPVRLAKLQDQRRAAAAAEKAESEAPGRADGGAGAGVGGNGGEQGAADSKRGISIAGNGGPAAAAAHNKPEKGEADRALELVSKKLSKTLSVTATVNDLINQATDERNLAVLYSGWAAYA